MRKHVIPTMYERTGWRYWFALGVAAVFALITVFHLFKYEDLSDALMLYMPSLTSANADMLAALIVIAEVFAIAYFLPLLLSKLARVLSALLAVAVPLLWLYVYTSGYIEWNGKDVEAPGLIGVPLGIFFVLHSFLLVAVVVVLISDKSSLHVSE